MINIIIIQKVYKKQEIKEIKQIDREFNFINTIIKSKLY